jgi:cysteine sulfinate desulfinase/cysteine desulfurase-like protein
LFPVDRIAEICQPEGRLFHCDAVQAAGNVEIAVRKIPADQQSVHANFRSLQPSLTLAAFIAGDSLPGGRRGSTR